jgi:hypothetical protein
MFSHDIERIAAKFGAIKTSSKLGWPSKYSQELDDEIFTLLSEGNTMKSICTLPHMPDITTIFKWERENGEFSQLSARAREAGTHVIADQCIEIADDPNLNPADKRVRIDTRLRHIGKWNTKKHGFKIYHAVQHGFIPLDELRRRIAESEARHKIQMEENKLLRLPSLKVSLNGQPV